MDIERLLNGLEDLIVAREIYCNEKQFNNPLWFEYTKRMDQIKEQILDYVKNLEEDAWKYRDAQD